METASPQPPKPAVRSIGQSLARWSLIVLIGLGGALVIDMARQSLASDRVEWMALRADELAAPNPAGYGLTPTTPSDAETRPRLIRFTADWCGPCRAMTARVFSKQAVADAVHARFDAYNVDLTQPGPEQQAIAAYYRITYLPTLLITDAQGRELARLDEAAGPEAFLSWLEHGWENTAQDPPQNPSQPGRAVSPFAHHSPVH